MQITLFLHYVRVSERTYDCNFTGNDRIIRRMNTRLYSHVWLHANYHSPVWFTLPFYRMIQNFIVLRKKKEQKIPKRVYMFNYGELLCSFPVLKFSLRKFEFKSTYFDASNQRHTSFFINRSYKYLSLNMKNWQYSKIKKWRNIKDNVTAL